MSAACEHARLKEPDTFGTVLCSALTIKKTHLYRTDMGQEDLMNTAEDVADRVSSILAQQLFMLAATSLLAAN